MPMREFIRHPSDIPIAYSFADGGALAKDYLNNISQGGLCFRARVYIEPDRVIRISIHIREPAFEVTGLVMWCRRTNEHYDTGVKLEDATAELSVRMVEQVCHIEHYRKEVLEKEGRKLSGKEAAAEWISRFAEGFPR